APDFEGGLIVVGENVALKIGGYVKADLIHDYDAIDSTDSFDTTSIPTSGIGRENTRFHARQSRLSFDTRWRLNGEVAKAFVEADFFGGDGDFFRLRHAYGRVGNFTAGQTWTTFTDPSAVPQTLDFEGAVSNVNRRQGLVRWDQPLWIDSLSLAIAVEDPRIIVEAPSLVSGEGRTESPDFITRLRSEHDWGEFQGAFVLRHLGFQPVGEPVIDGTAWGFNFTGAAMLGERTRAYSQITFGEGIGSYRGSPDVVATGPDTAEILPMFGWMIGVHHEWADRLTSNFTYSKLSLEDLPGQDPTNLRDTTYLAANIIANPYERVFCGVEYLYGIREDASGAQGDAHRIQMSFGFYLP
ncbi:MAG: DcaP family trimeric outer membrane transporter, partial [Pirellulaceae bacterium]